MIKYHWSSNATENCCDGIRFIIEKELTGLNISKAGLSVAGIILIKFGNIAIVESRNRDSAYETRDVGEWELLVEQADWSITKDSAVICSADSSSDEINAAISDICNDEISSISIERSGSITISTSDGNISLEVKPTECRLERLSQWIIFRRNKWSLEFTYDCEFVLSD